MTEIIGFQPEDLSSEAWEISIDSQELLYLRENYKEISDDEFNNIVGSASNLLSRCPNPSARNGKKTGLAIGKVQSGKTLSFTALIALAASNGYGIVVVLAGTKIPLMTQTHDRLIKDLGIMQQGGTRRIYIQSNPRLNIVESLTSALQSNKCALLVVLKNTHHLQQLTEVIRQLPKTPLLIIDDEGDEASLNTYFRRGEQSAIYRHITSLRDLLRDRPHAYIAYTATPQANLLLEAVNGLHPDFCELIEPGRGYCGASVFFGLHKENYIRQINDLDEEAAEGGSIPPSLKTALAIFFVAAVIRHMRIEYEKHSMLIHMNVRTESHRRLFGSVSDLINKWKGQIKSRSADLSRRELIELFKLAYQDLQTTMINPPTWEDVESRIAKELISCEFYMVNSLREGVRLSERTFQLDNHIVVGGNILGRGLTIQNLAVSYMTRRARQATNADTMEQRARWFGYKMGYLDLCRIFLPDRIKDDYEGLLRHEDDFWDSLRRNIAQGIPLPNWSRFFTLDTELGLNPTRASVARYRRFEPHGWDTQNKPIADPNIVRQNMEMINSFFQRHSTQEIAGKHTIIRNCPLKDAIELLRGINTNGTDWEASYNIEYLERLLIQGVLSSIDVVLMSKGALRVRSLIENDMINNLMEGRNANYLGDREIHNNRVQLQIHYIQCKKGLQMLGTTTALAIFIPEDDNLNLSFIVRGDSQ